MQKIFEFILSLIIRPIIKKNLADSAKLVNDDLATAKIEMSSREETADLLERYCRRNPDSPRCRPEYRAHVLRLTKSNKS